MMSGRLNSGVKNQCSAVFLGIVGRIAGHIVGTVLQTLLNCRRLEFYAYLRSA